MDEAQSVRQIQQMVNFILNEAKDKAEEIDAKTLEEFNVEKLKYVQGQKEKIRGELLEKKKKQESAIAIARSAAINRSRMQAVEARQNSMIQLKQECEANLAAVSKDRNRYSALCSDLIVQGCLKLMEDQVTVKCRKEDEQAIKASLDSASRKYSEIIKKETGVAKAVRLDLSNAYLPSSCGGGVVLTCMGNSISIDNTLFTRLSLVVDNDLPALRKMLFPRK
mmetsp:Transcript_4362/g.10674  ORF Transcript_4362/g.10674 Transcript_4362/m.10674 type:complete len:223 (+) Transcript_4362:94-762(+)